VRSSVMSGEVTDWDLVWNDEGEGLGVGVGVEEARTREAMTVVRCWVRNADASDDTARLSLVSYIYCLSGSLSNSETNMDMVQSKATQNSGPRR